MFTSKTLTDLKLNSKFKILSNIPSSPSAPIFPCLKKLTATFYCFDTEAYKHFVSQCSALEHLIVKSNLTQIHIVSSSMKRLELHVWECRDLGEKILLGVPSLEYLKIHCKVPSDLIIEDGLSSLIEAHIEFYDYLYGTEDVKIKQFRDSFVRFMQPLYNVKVLRLVSKYQWFLNSVGHGLFLNLTKLHIESNFYEWRLLVSLMESSNNLEAITLKKNSTLKKHKLVWIVPKNVPISLSSSLRKISIDGCCMDRHGRHACSEDELLMLKYVLRNARILERMDIRCSNDLFDKIQKLPRACEICEISQLKEPCFDVCSEQDYHPYCF